MKHTEKLFLFLVFTILIISPVNAQAGITGSSRTIVALMPAVMVGFLAFLIISSFRTEMQDENSDMISKGINVTKLAVAIIISFLIFIVVFSMLSSILAVGT